jgi:hypothetical protein
MIEAKESASIVAEEEEEEENRTKRVDFNRNSSRNHQQ